MPNQLVHIPLWLMMKQQGTVDFVNFQTRAVLGASAHDHHTFNFFHLVGVLVSAKQLRNVQQTLVYVLQGGAEESLTAVCLIYCLNCYQFS